MRDKKSLEPDAAPEEQALEHKVDAMMDPKQPDPAPASSDDEPGRHARQPGEPPAIDIFKDLPDTPVETINVTTGAPRTAPELSDSLPTTKKISIVDANRLRSSLPPTPARPSDTTAGPAEVEEPEAVSEPAEPSPTAETPTDTAELKNTLDDAKTDAAVDQIAAADGDKVLAAEDAANSKASAPVTKPKRALKAKLKAFFTDKRTWIGFAVLLVIIAAVPWTRYKVAGLAIHKSLSATVLDTKTGTPVSGALVSFNGHQAKTNADGKVDFRVPVGNGQVTVTKQYYTSYSHSLMVGFGSTKPLKLQLNAIGRQVPLTVLNKITGEPLAGATIKVLNTTAKTNAKGQATIVLPASNSTDKATVSLVGYNVASLNIQVTSSVVPANNLTLTPAGKVYFLSNATGNIDVVSTNLDGSNRQTVFAGTGSEDPNNTNLLASRDWRYLVLESQRSGNRPALYLIDTSDNKVTEFDSSNSSFQLIGWYGHYFMYDLTSNTIPQYQAGNQTIKSYDADTQQLNQLDSGQAQGSSTSYAYQTFNGFYILNNLLVYTTQWFTNAGSGPAVDVSSDSDTIRGVQPGGQGSKKDYQSFPVSQTNYIQASLYEPQAIYYDVNNSTTNDNTYYEFENQSLSADNSLTQATFNQSYPTYLISPSSKQTFWTDLRDGANALFVGDANAQSAKQLTSDGSYKPYGWYTDSYLLVSKDSDKLYILPARPSGSTAGQATGSKTTNPVLISNYYKSPQDFAGYGYGYGGL